MSDRNVLFFSMGFMYSIHFMVMWRETLRSSASYGSFVEAVAKVYIVVGPCSRMM